MCIRDRNGVENTRRRKKLRTDFEKNWNSNNNIRCNIFYCTYIYIWGCLYVCACARVSKTWIDFLNQVKNTYETVTINIYKTQSLRIYVYLSLIHILSAHIQTPQYGRQTGMLVYSWEKFFIKSWDPGKSHQIIKILFDTKPSVVRKVWRNQFVWTIENQSDKTQEGRCDNSPLWLTIDHDCLVAPFAIPHILPWMLTMSCIALDSTLPVNKRPT